MGPAVLESGPTGVGTLRQVSFRGLSCFPNFLKASIASVPKSWDWTQTAWPVGPSSITPYLNVPD